MWSKDEFLCIIHDKMDHVKLMYGHEMKDMHNIQMSCGLMIPILQLGPYCAFVALWKYP